MQASPNIHYTTLWELGLRDLVKENNDILTTTIGVNIALSFIYGLGASCHGTSIYKIRSSSLVSL